MVKMECGLRFHEAYEMVQMERHWAFCAGREGEGESIRAEWHPVYGFHVVRRNGGKSWPECDVLAQDWWVRGFVMVGKG